MADLIPAFVRRRPLAVLLAICILAWLPGFFTLPPLDRDESRFAQSSKQMLETHDFVDIRLGQETRYQKPVGIYWMQAASTAALGGGAQDRIWTYRVPSLLGALAAVAATFWLVRAFAGVEAAFFAGLLLGLSVLLMSEAKIAKTDAVLLGCIVTMHAVLIRTYLSIRSPQLSAAPGRGIALLGWAAFGLGMLVKGPVVAAIGGGTILALVLWDRDWRWLAQLHAASGIALALAILLPWLIAIALASGGVFFEKSLGQDFAQKLIGDQETHGGPPGYYTLLAPLTFWPGSLLLLPGVLYGVARRREPAIRFLLAWAAAAWVIFEAAPTKLPHYVLPAYPALAALCGLWLTSPPHESRAPRFSRYASLALFVAVGLALVAFAAWAPQRFGTGTPWWFYLPAGLAVAAVLAVIPLTIARRSSAAVAMACLSAFLVYAIAGYLTVPLLAELWLSPRLADAVTRHAAPNDPPVVTAGYAEPSIAFLLGTQTQLDSGLDAGRAAASSGGLALVAEEERGDFLDALERGGARAEALEEIKGLNYSRGREIRVTLYRVVPREK